MLSVAFSYCDAECHYAEWRGAQLSPFWLPLQNVNPKFSSKYTILKAPETFYTCGDS
jgi:hypothetical protein